MKINAAGIALLKQFEGLELKPYHDAAGIPTIGYGHVIRQHESHLTDGITAAEADALLRADLAEAEGAVKRYVNVTLNENQFAALVSLVFNIGGGAFKASTIRRLVNARQYAKAAGEFDRWVYAGGKKLAGLARRRRCRTHALREARAKPSAERSLMFTLVKDGDKFEPPGDEPPVITPNVALIAALKQVKSCRRVIIITEDYDENVMVRQSTMTDSQGHDITAAALAMFRIALRKR